ncbi:MAG: PTS sugar transporter subunit IIA [Deltaproteobacteria bacterium]|jgi:PTS system nitrogen regulatory IIA component
MNLTVKDAAPLLEVSEKTIYRWIKQGTIPAYRVNEQYRFNRAELLEWATSRRINVAPEMFQEPETDGLPLPSLSDALESGGIFYRIEGKRRNEVIAQAVHHLRLPDGTDRDYLLKLLIAREHLASTAVGEGIAIPHMRHPEAIYVASPAVSLCFLEHEVDFQALDGKPVHILFTLISPTLRAHLHLLSTLSLCLRNALFQDVLRRPGGREEILAVLRRTEAGLRHSESS